MKVKLSENYQIVRAGILGENSFLVRDKIRNIYSDKLENLNELSKLIEKYEKALSDLNKISLPESYKATVAFTLTRNSFHLKHDDFLLKTFDDAFELEKTVNQETNFDLQLAKLNNGEEIEI